MDLELLNRSEFRIVVISLAVLIAERLRPWRKTQPFTRPELIQDLLFFGFNAFALGHLFGFAFSAIGGGLKAGMVALFGPGVAKLRVLENLPLYVQIPLGLVLIDFVEWTTHNLRHRVPLLWRFHRLHHSIRDMDWIGNFRFHPFEVFFYYTTKFIPLMLPGTSRTAMFVGDNRFPAPFWRRMLLPFLDTRADG